MWEPGCRKHPENEAVGRFGCSFVAGVDRCFGHRGQPANLPPQGLYPAATPLTGGVDLEDRPHAPERSDGGFLKCGLGCDSWYKSEVSA